MYVDKERLNDWLDSRKNRKDLYDHQQLFKSIRLGDRGALSRGITLLESTKEQDRVEAQLLLRLSLPFAGKAVRVGITGVPGVGKSTFIEAFGMQLIEQGKKVAVLAVDPSSERTHGSILGDKTRMDLLAVQANAFIRPSPAGTALGGVARKTREAIFLCELAGFDYVLVETVGVGQSETSVHSMVDFFLLLMLSGAGDELQGIKRGIMEMADLLVVTKADGENILAAKRARSAYQNALHLFPANKNGWISKAITASSFNTQDVEAVLEQINQFMVLCTENGSLKMKRNQQDLYWLDETLKELILDNFYKTTGFPEKLHELRREVLEGKISSFEAAENLFNSFT